MMKRMNVSGCYTQIKNIFNLKDMRKLQKSNAYCTVWLQAEVVMLIKSYTPVLTLSATLLPGTVRETGFYKYKQKQLFQQLKRLVVS